MTLKAILAASIAFLGLAAGAPVLAQDAAQGFPKKTITIVIPASPGGAIDLTARLVGQKLSETWGQPVVIDNKPGATGIIGTDAIARATAVLQGSGERAH